MVGWIKEKNYSEKKIKNNRGKKCGLNWFRSHLHATITCNWLGKLKIKHGATSSCIELCEILTCSHYTFGYLGVRVEEAAGSNINY